MDWTTFFGDNSQSFLPLGGVFLGSAITFLISYLNNRFEARERDKDREEQRREAKTQLALELMRNDIKIIDDSINNSLQALELSRNLAFKRDRGKLSHGEMLDELGSTLANESGTTFELQTDYIADKAAFSLGEDFYSSFKACEKLRGDYSDLMLSASPSEEEDAELSELWNKIIIAAAKLHIMMNEKLISFRDN